MLENRVIGPERNFLRGFSDVSVIQTEHTSTSIPNSTLTSSKNKPLIDDNSDPYPQYFCRTEHTSTSTPNSALTSSTSNLSLSMGGRRIGDRLKWEPTDLEKMRRILIPKRRADNQKFNSAKVLLGGLKPEGK
ncbi:hypothetical protein CDAR_477861 [Caerostris darwini]|uniref:Uncharacterized protein n=1 Tax=Caerostris darwini TaxID=1538125 RepID=A0AAV4Q1P2_9ARAC|nr:hypothetical protein CDAR_477861 [Caerostris darwini]